MYQRVKRHSRPIPALNKEFFDIFHSESLRWALSRTR
jgi:hypothetical protein